MSRASIPTVAVAEHVYGVGPGLDDPAETFHEASRLYPRATPPPTPGLLLLLEGDAVMHASVGRAARRYEHRPAVTLPPARLPRTPLSAALGVRRSGLGKEPRPTAAPLPLERLSTLLACAYASRGRPDGDRRLVPSGGALYPLELYAVGLAVAGLPPALYHYDPYGHRLELLREGDMTGELADVLVDPALATGVTAAIVLTGVFWRSRFKYGQRGYRFVLLEAGHVGQNVALAAAALGVPMLPVGGFYDRRVEELLTVEPPDEAALYVLLLGGAG